MYQFRLCSLFCKTRGGCISLDCVHYSVRPGVDVSV